MSEKRTYAQRFENEETEERPAQTVTRLDRAPTKLSETKRRVRHCAQEREKHTLDSEERAYWENELSAAKLDLNKYQP